MLYFNSELLHEQLYAMIFECALYTIFDSAADLLCCQCSTFYVCVSAVWLVEAAPWSLKVSNVVFLVCEEDWRAVWSWMRGYGAKFYLKMCTEALHCVVTVVSLSCVWCLDIRVNSAYALQENKSTELLYRKRLMTAVCLQKVLACIFCNAVWVVHDVWQTMIDVRDRKIVLIHFVETCLLVMDIIFFR